MRKKWLNDHKHPSVKGSPSMSGEYEYTYRGGGAGHKDEPGGRAGVSEDKERQIINYPHSRLRRDKY